MEIVLVGVSHKTAPVEAREHLAVLEQHVPTAIQELIDSGHVRECCILSTCNRTELYAAGEAAGHVAEAIVAHLSTRHAIARDVLVPHLYHRFNEDAVRHLFTVSAGLDSMILGEGQILSQVRKAHQLGLESNSTGSVVCKLFEHAIRVGKRARTETRIAQGAASVSFAAVELARKIHGNLEHKHVLVVGTGKMGVLTLRLLVSSGVAKITLLSRREESARRMVGELSGQLECKWGSMDNLNDALAESDIVISCTGAPSAVITRAQVRAVLRRRKYRPLFIVDIAVPRDVEPSTNELENVYLYNIDDLSSVVTDALRDRIGEIERVRAIVEDEVLAFSRYAATLETIPAIRRLREVFEQRRLRELDVLADRERLSEEERARLETLSRGLLSRLLHEPMVRMKEMAVTRNVQDGVRFLLELFDTVDREDTKPVQPTPANREEIAP